MRFVIFLLCVLTPCFLQAQENTILLGGGKVITRAPADWVIIGHHPIGPQNALAFHILGNEAENGTRESTNLIYTSYDLAHDKSAFAFVEQLIAELKEGETQSKHGEWLLRSRKAKQGEVEYDIIDARRNLEKHGMHVRIAWPQLKANPKDYDKKMIALLKQRLDIISKINEKKKEVIDKKD